MAKKCVLSSVPHTKCAPAPSILAQGAAPQKVTTADVTKAWVLPFYGGVEAIIYHRVWRLKAAVVIILRSVITTDGPSSVRDGHDRQRLVAMREDAVTTVREQGITELGVGGGRTKDAGKS